MPTKKSPRKGSLQFWPRKRANKILPRVNWNKIEKDSVSIKGFLGYKAGMASAHVKDNTPDSMTKGKKITIPITIIECPPLKIFSVRFYKENKVVKEILSEIKDKELRRKLKIPKNYSKKIDDIKIDDVDDIKVICYSLVKKTNIKKTPDLIEIGLSGNLNEKFEFIKNNLTKEISINDILKKGELVDFRGLTKGKGLQGPVKRFGIKLKKSKSEKGRRRPGSLGPWHPARVTFRVPMAGQLGFFTRVTYNSKVVEIGKVENQNYLKNINRFGDLKTDYMIVQGSVQGSQKRQLIITFPLRKTKKQSKKDYEVLEIK